jgi:predicted PurR-regulated permease PerM
MADETAPAKRRRISTEMRLRRLYLTAFICVLAMWIVLPFLTPIAWAFILTIAEWPLYRRVLARWPDQSSWIALAFAVATALLVILPLSIAAISLAQESQSAIDWLQQAQKSGVPVPSWVAGLPLVGSHASNWWQQHLTTAQGANTTLGAISVGSVLTWLRSAAAEVAKESALFLVTLVILAAVLSRGERFAAQAVASAGRVFGDFGEDFVERMTDAVRSTVNGTLLVSFGEGALIGVGYAVTGVPQPLLFATLTIILALVPFGAWAAFGLASLILIGSGSTLTGVSLFVGGVIVMMVGDNVIQPAVIGGKVKLPFILAMLGAFGGLAALGLVGLFIGPVVMAALQLVLTEWMELSGKEN